MQVRKSSIFTAQKRNKIKYAKLQNIYETIKTRRVVDGVTIWQAHNQRIKAVDRSWRMKNKINLGLCHRKIPRIPSAYSLLCRFMILFRSTPFESSQNAQWDARNKSNFNFNEFISWTENYHKFKVFESYLKTFLVMLQEFGESRFSKKLCKKLCFVHIKILNNLKCFLTDLCKAFFIRCKLVT